jgi:nucleosome assembly protein 1-like 1
MSDSEDEENSSGAEDGANGGEQILLDDEHEDEDDVDDDDEQNRLAHLPEYVISRVEKLRDLNTHRDDIMNDYLVERAALEYKFATLLAPLYDERTLIVKGEMDDAIAAENSTTVDAAAADAQAPRVKGIPQFWLCAISQDETIGEMLTERDIDCLDHLENVTCVDDEDGKGFVLSFYFTPNDYFHDQVLVKTYSIPNLLLSDEPMLKNVVGTKIQWKMDRCLTYREIKKKQRGKGKHTGRVRTVTKTEKSESFFHWFEPPPFPKLSDVDEEKAEELEEYFDADYEVAQALRSHIIPQAVLWFTGEVRKNLIFQDNLLGHFFARLTTALSPLP